MTDTIRKNIKLSKRFFSIKEARIVAKKKLPKLIFDFVDGASGMRNYQKLIILH